MKMNKQELKRLKKIKDELEIMRDSEKKKLKNLFRIGASRERTMKVNRSSTSLECAVDYLNDLF